MQQNPIMTAETEPSSALGAPTRVHGDELVVQVGSPPHFFKNWTRDYRQMWDYRELLWQLVRKELKVKYKGSFLGFLWTLARPTFQIAIYYLAFTVFLGNQQPAYAIFIFTGLIAWTLFTDIVGGSTGCIVGNGPLINKTAFPREMFPLAVTGAAIVNFLAQLPVLAVALLIAALSGQTWQLTSWVLVVPLAALVAIVLGTACGLFLSAVTVYLRDVQHLIEVVMLAWFWITPVVYPAVLPVKHLAESHPLVLQAYLANPMVMVVSAFQHAFYTMGTEYLYQGNVAGRLGICLVVCLVLLWLAQRVFAKLSANFAQEL